MSQFEYLSVLVSIIIGLAITQLLSGTARLVQLRRRVKPHTTTLLWIVILFLIDTQIWWAAFERRDRESWDFFLFLFYLLQPILAFLLSSLVLPELGDEDDIDLTASFETNRPWFFGLLALLPFASLVDEYLYNGSIVVDADSGFRVIFCILALLASRIRSARIQFWLAVLALALVCCYVALFVPAPALSRHSGFHTSPSPRR